METEAALNGGRPPIWKIWANPIVRRYARSRLRPRGLGVALLITLMIASFLFFIFRAGVSRMDMSSADIARVPLIPLLVLQGLILFVLATGQMAGGITAEADEGVIDYQRLAPMTPLAKVLGYLFGLPIREYVLFLATMPFTLWSLWRGQVPLEYALQLYGVFMVAAVLYHLTGLVAGTVVKNRRWAFLMSMGMVFLLYTVVPQASKIGLVYFKYVTIEPVFKECLPYLLPRDAGAGIETLRNLVPPARFFDLDLPQWVFTVVTQAVLILVMGVMLWRRWYRAESHLLGKVGAVGLFAWVQVMLLGNALPLIEAGDVFPSSAQRKWAYFRFQGYEWVPEPEEVVLMAGAYGIVTMLILWTMVLMITPNRDRQIRGWRRTRKLETNRLSPGSDPATSFPWVGIMVLIGAAGWFWFTKEVVESDWFGGTVMPVNAVGAFLLVLATAGFGFHALLEGKGARAAGLCAILGGAAPILLGTVLALSDLVPLGIWIMGMSPVAGPVYATGSVLPLVDFDADLMRGLPRAFWFWQVVAGLLALDLIWKLWGSRKAIAARSLHDGEDQSPPEE